MTRIRNRLGNQRELQVAVAATNLRSGAQVNVPAGARLRVNFDENGFVTATVTEPAHMAGTVIRYTATADEPVDGAQPGAVGKPDKPVATPEQLAHREHYRTTIKHVLAKILDWENLPAVDAESFAHGIRDLGPVTDFADAHIAASPKRLRNWLHHVNMEIPSRSLTVELARFPNDERHLVLVLTTAW